MEGVDQDEVGAGVLSSHLGQIAQGGEITDSPAALGAHRVQLRHNPVSWGVEVLIGGAQPGGGYCQVAFGVLVAV